MIHVYNDRKHKYKKELQMFKSSPEYELGLVCDQTWDWGIRKFSLMLTISLEQEILHMSMQHREQKWRLKRHFNKYLEVTV